MDNEFLKAVFNMRSSQKKARLTRRKEDFLTAKMYSREVDAWIASYQTSMLKEQDYYA